MTGRRAGVLLLVAAAAAGLDTTVRAGDGAPAPPETTVSGTLEGRTTWSGIVRVTGDVEIPEGSGLFIEAGTRVVIASGDSTRSGWNAQRVEIHVKGDLLVSGSAEKPVTFEPEGGPPEVGASRENHSGKDGSSLARDLARFPWHGLVLWPPKGGRPREIHGARFSSAFSGIQVPGGRARIEDCVFLKCGTGVEVGSAYADGDRFGTAGDVARPTITGCRFTACGTGVFVQHRGAPRLERCVFHLCNLGAGGNRVTGRHYPVTEPGVTAERCDFVDNGVGLEGPFLVLDCLFSGNERALKLSDFHVRHGTGVDLVRVRGSVFGGNGSVLDGESVGDGARVVDAVGYAGGGADLGPALRSPWPPLPDALELAGDSPARGAAEGGGNPGCRALRAPPAERVPWRPAGFPLLQPLAVDPGDGDEALEGLPRQKPKPGGSFRGSWWCVAGREDDGTVPLAPLGGREGKRAALAWRVDADRGGDGTLELNGDLDFLEAWWNGDRLPRPGVPRRYGRHGALISVTVKRGANLLVVLARGRGPTPALSVSLQVPPNVKLKEEAPSAEPKETRITSVRILRDKSRGEGAWLRVSVSAPLSWTTRGEVRLRDGSGNDITPRGAGYTLEDRTVLVYGPLPEDPPAEGGVVLSGFRGADGAECVFPAGATGVGK